MTIRAKGGRGGASAPSVPVNQQKGSTGGCGGGAGQVETLRLVVLPWAHKVEQPHKTSVLIMPITLTGEVFSTWF